MLPFKCYPYALRFTGKDAHQEKTCLLQKSQTGANSNQQMPPMQNLLPMFWRAQNDQSGRSQEGIRKGYFKPCLWHPALAFQPHFLILQPSFTPDLVIDDDSRRLPFVWADKENMLCGPDSTLAYNSTNSLTSVDLLLIWCDLAEGRTRPTRLSSEPAC